MTILKKGTGKLRTVTAVLLLGTFAVGGCSQSTTTTPPTGGPTTPSANADSASASPSEPTASQSPDDAPLFPRITTSQLNEIEAAGLGGTKSRHTYWAFKAYVGSSGEGCGEQLGCTPDGFLGIAAANREGANRNDKGIVAAFKGKSRLIRSFEPGQFYLAEITLVNVDHESGLPLFWITRNVDRKVS